MNKIETRSRIRQQRRMLSPHQQHIHAMEVARQVAKSSWYRRARHIGIYLPADGELSTEFVINHSRNFSKHLYLPVLHPFRHGRLLFCEWREDSVMTPNRFGILEPDIQHNRIMHPRSLDIVIVPLVAFDVQRNRLGMGGGYYDRTFEASRVRSEWKRPRLIGVAHELQKQKLLATRSWDISLDAVITEEGLY